jgi:tetratricopeptide (TPR) repeat protein
LGVFDRAMALFKKALKISTLIFKSFTNCHNANILNSVGDLLIFMGYKSSAEKFLNISNEIRMKLLDRNHPEVASSMYSLNNVAMLDGNIDKAIQGHEEVLDIRRNVIGQMHRDVAKCLNSLGLCLIEKGQYLEARSLLERSLSMRKKLLGTEHPDVGESLHSLGLVSIAQVILICSGTSKL